MEPLLNRRPRRSGPRCSAPHAARGTAAVGLILCGAAALAGALTLMVATPAVAGDTADRHAFSVALDLAAVNAETPLGAWPAGGLGKLRFAGAGDSITVGRLAVQYRGRVTPTLFAHAVADWVDDGSAGLGVTEAYLDWRPIPRSQLRQRWRFGAFYPPFSLENGGTAWSDVLTIAPSAINTWLGEEIRPMGAEWSLRRRFGHGRSPQEFGVFAAGFYGNDPAATLLFWRGWALHDRQSRLTDRLPLPPIPTFGSGTTAHFVANRVEPFHEVDGRAGLYGGLEWQYARRAVVQLAVYDNRADPNRYAGGQWGWHTRFRHAAVQVALPAQFGLAAQWLTGATRWQPGGLPDGKLLAGSGLVTDDFASWYLLATRRLGVCNDLTVRYDDFETRRPGTTPAFVSDRGEAWTLAFRRRQSDTLTIVVEWLRVHSERALWPVYGVAPENAEKTLRLDFRLAAGRRS